MLETLIGLVVGAFLASVLARRDERWARLREAYADWQAKLEEWIEAEQTLCHWLGVCSDADDREHWEQHWWRRRDETYSALTTVMHRLLLLENDPEYRAVVWSLSTRWDELHGDDDDYIAYQSSLQDRRLGPVEFFRHALIRRFTTRRSWLRELPAFHADSSLTSVLKPAHLKECLWAAKRHGHPVPDEWVTETLKPHMQ